MRLFADARASGQIRNQALLGGMVRTHRPWGWFRADLFAAVMLVDPAFDSFRWTNHHANSAPACTILQDPTTHARLDALWAARNKGHMILTRDTSTAYHGGSHTLSGSTLSLASARSRRSVLDPRRNKSSPLDEIVLHWTQIADKELIQSARENSVNSTHYLLKYLANLWVHSLDLVQSTIAQSEYFSEEYQAKVDMNISSEEWREKLTEVVDATSDMHNLRRQMIHFEYQLGLNLERLGIVLGAEKVNPLEQDAIRCAQMDFLNLYNRLKPFVARAIVLDKTANDLANFYTNFIGIQYSQVGLKLSIFASVVFPATLVSSIFSMGTDYLPGQPLFWVFWAVTIPVVFLVAGGMLFSQYIESWFTHRLGPKSKKVV
jgi:hypothetical protein